MHEPSDFTHSIKICPSTNTSSAYSSKTMAEETKPRLKQKASAARTRLERPTGNWKTDAPSGNALHDFRQFMWDRTGNHHHPWKFRSVCVAREAYESKMAQMVSTKSGFADYECSHAE